MLWALGRIEGGRMVVRRVGVSGVMCRRVYSAGRSGAADGIVGLMPCGGEFGNGAVEMLWWG